jgi:hypothetical protein
MTNDLEAQGIPSQEVDSLRAELPAAGHHTRIRRNLIAHDLPCLIGLLAFPTRICCIICTQHERCCHSGAGPQAAKHIGVRTEHFLDALCRLS